MTIPQFCDVSQWQGAIDWQAYKIWSAQGDGISRVAMRSSYGTGFADSNFAENRAGALAAGIDCIYYYHFSYPSVNGAVQEANWQRQVVGDVRPQDMLMLDFEENSPQATSAWAYSWLATQEANYGKLPGLYASSAYIAERLQDPRLARYPLWVANWQYTPDERPPCPPPWTSYQFVQFTDKATSIPGISGNVDCNIFLGQEEEPPMSQVPAGWTDDGTTLKAPDGTPVTLGFRDHILNGNWDPANVPLEQVQHLSILEQSNPSIGAGQEQTFRWKRLEYTPKAGVFEGWLGQELLWYQTAYAKLQTQVALLSSQVASLQSQLSGNTLAQENAALLAKIAQAQKDLS